MHASARPEPHICFSVSLIGSSNLVQQGLNGNLAVRPNAANAPTRENSVDLVGNVFEGFHYLTELSLGAERNCRIHLMRNRVSWFPVTSQ